MKISGKGIIAGLAGAGLLAFAAHKLFKKSRDEEAEAECPNDEEDVEEVSDDE